MQGCYFTHLTYHHHAAIDGVLRSCTWSPRDPRELLPGLTVVFRPAFGACAGPSTTPTSVAVLATLSLVPVLAWRRRGARFCQVRVYIDFILILLYFLVLIPAHGHPASQLD